MERIEKYLPALLLVLALLGLALLWRVLNPPKARVVLVEPKPGEENVSLEVRGRVVFDRAVGSPDKVKLSITPQKEPRIVWGSDKKSFEFSFAEELSPLATYQISIQGPGVVPFSWIFETESLVEVGGIGSEDVAEAWEEYKRRNPLSGIIMPVLTKDFKIINLGEGRVRVTLYTREASSSALQWFREHGVDPEKLEIEWIE